MPQSTEHKSTKIASFNCTVDEGFDCRGRIKDEPRNAVHRLKRDGSCKHGEVSDGVVVFISDAVATRAVKHGRHWDAPAAAVVIGVLNI